MKSLTLILFWVSFVFFFTLYARNSDAAELILEANAIRTFQNVKSSSASAGQRGCIGVDRASTSSGAYIKQFTCDGSDNQTWLLRSAAGSSGFYNFQNKNSDNMCMGVDRASRNPGADIRQFPCDSSLNQRWFLAFDVIPECPSPDPANVCIINVKSGLCVGVDRASTANGAQLKQFQCDGRINQSWRQR